MHDVEPTGWRARSSVPTIIPPPTIAGFEQVKRYFDPKLKRVSAKILPGEFYVTTADEMVTTVLGSCVSACVWDPEAGIGGMNHFMLPNFHEGSGHSAQDSDAARYGVFAMEFLINTVLSNGGDRRRLLVKLAGGGNVIRSATDVGHTNVGFARSYLASEELPLVAEHVEGANARRLVFHPLSGRSRVLELSTVEHGAVVESEQHYATTITRSEQTPGHVELF